MQNQTPVRNEQSREHIVPSTYLHKERLQDAAVMQGLTVMLLAR